MGTDAAALRKMVWEVVAFELETITPFTGPTFTLDEVVAGVWEWNHDELSAAGVRKEDVRPIVVEVFDHIEEHGWDTVRDEFQRAAEARKPAGVSPPPPPPPRGPIDPPF